MQTPPLKRYVQKALTAALLMWTMLGCNEGPEERAVALMEDLATISEQHANNCEAMGKAFDALLEKNKATITKLKTLRKGKTEKELEELELRFGPRRFAAAKKMARTALPCAKEPSVIAALKKM